MIIKKEAKIQITKTKDTKKGESCNARIPLTKSLLDMMGFGDYAKVEYDLDKGVIIISN